MAKIATVNQTKNGTSSKIEEIQQLAYQFYVDRGFAHGYDQEDWARAEAIVKNRKRA